MRNFDLALAILELPQPDPVPLRMSWMRRAGGSYGAFTHWFVCRWMKRPCRADGVTFSLANSLRYWSPNAVAPWEWP